MLVDWDALYNSLGIRDFIYFISSPTLQEMLFPIKLVFIAFSGFFLFAVFYFYRNSSYLRQEFYQDVTEFLSWQSYGMRETVKRLKKIQKRIETGLESEFKLAIIEADDFLSQVLDEKGYKGETFEELVHSAGRVMFPNIDEILEAHKTRNSIVYDSDFRIDGETANKILFIYETAIKNVAAA